MKEKIAEQAHELWSHWMRHYFTLPDPSAHYERWKRLMNTPYIELTEEEKESDRKVGEAHFEALVNEARAEGAGKGYLNTDENKFVKQTIVGEFGNCHSATIASLLGITIEEAWNVDRDVAEGESWTQSLRAWLDRRGFVYLYVHASTGFVPTDYHLMSGKSPRGFQHSVIGYQGKPVFDPHPEGGFLTSVDGYELIIPKGAPFLNNWLSATKSGPRPTGDGGEKS